MASATFSIRVVRISKVERKTNHHSEEAKTHLEGILSAGQPNEKKNHLISTITICFFVLVVVELTESHWFGYCDITTTDTMMTMMKNPLTLVLLLVGMVAGFSPVFHARPSFQLHSAVAEDVSTDTGATATANIRNIAVIAHVDHGKTTL